MSGLQPAQILLAAAAAHFAPRSPVDPPWPQFLQFPNVFGAPFLENHSRLGQSVNSVGGTDNIHCTSYQDSNKDYSNDEGEFCVFPSVFYY